MPASPQITGVRTWSMAHSMIKYILTINPKIRSSTVTTRGALRFLGSNLSRISSWSIIIDRYFRLAHCFIEPSEVTANKVGIHPVLWWFQTNLSIHWHSLDQSETEYSDTVFRFSVSQSRGDWSWSTMVVSSAACFLPFPATRSLSSEVELFPIPSTAKTDEQTGRSIFFRIPAI